MPPLRAVRWLAFFSTISVLFFIATCIQIYLYPSVSGFHPKKNSPTRVKQGGSDRETTAAVVATQHVDDVSWMNESGLEVWKYEVDNNATARLRTPINKGAEAMVYLTHIIDQYDNLTSRVVFLHAGRFQWHNDDENYDGLEMLRALNLPYINQVGYTSLRCAWYKGCPIALYLLPSSQEPHVRPPPSSNDQALLTYLYTTTLPRLLPQYNSSLAHVLNPVLDNITSLTQPLPTTISAACCAQFAVTRDVILANPKALYVHIRQWLIESPETDYFTGRVMEYIWHMLFTGRPVECPDAEKCYCGLYGKCDLTCDSVASVGEGRNVTRVGAEERVTSDCGVYIYAFGWRWLVGTTKRIFRQIWGWRKVSVNK